MITILVSWIITDLKFSNYLKKKAAGRLSVNLVHPTCAKIRDECIIRFIKGCNTDDLVTVKSFFQRPIDEKISVTAIKRFDINKFKPLCNFLKKGLHTHEKNIELLAWLIDFNLRPYSRFVDIIGWEALRLSNSTVSSTGDILERLPLMTDNVEGYKNTNNDVKVMATKQLTLVYPSGVKLKVDAADLDLIAQLVKLR